MGRQRLLLIAPHGSYRTAPFVDIAAAIGIDLLIASEGKYSLVSAYADGLHIDLRDPEAAINRIRREADSRPFSGIVATDDSTTELACLVAERLNLPYNQRDAARIARRKDLAREALAQAKIPVPSFKTISLDCPLDRQMFGIHYPCVVKPLALSASRGVIRANCKRELLEAIRRIERILSSERDCFERRTVLVETFIPGVEIAMEGMLIGGVLEVLLLFDKPDPLEGPFFEESLYITPSKLDRITQNLIRDRVEAACRAYGLTEGPIHAECRINSEGVWILEVAARTIGGLCSRLFRYCVGRGLEEIVLYHAIGTPVEASRMEGAAGVLMIPIPQAGVLRRVEGLKAAGQVPYIEEVVIQIREGYELVPLPEGSSYLGFIFCKAPTGAAAELALRQAHQQLTVVTAPIWKGVAGHQ